VDANNKNNNSSANVTAYEYDEIDQIYQYVRGLASLPKNLNNFESLSETSPKLPHTHSNSPQKAEIRHMNSSNSKVVNLPRYSNTQQQQQLQDSSALKRENHLFNSDSWIKHELLEKPIPPSLKTIPSKKHLSQKRPTLIFAQQQQQQQQQRTNQCSSHGKISSPQQKDSIDLSPQSPLFHIR
jgi:hypothetical protein